MRWSRRAAIGTLAIAACFALSLYEAGEILSNPATHEVGAAPADLAARAVTLLAPDGTKVAGWSLRGAAGRGAVLLLHGARADRREMLDRARWLARNGFSVLLIDLPGHGESDGDHVTFGWREAAGVRAALLRMRTEFAGERIGVIGVSLGAAALVLARPEPPPDAVVLESMYPTLEEALGDRLALHLGERARALAPLLLWQVPLRLGVAAERIRPIEAIGSLQAPALVAAGRLDRDTRLEETERIFAAAHAPKELWIVEGAAHEDLHAFARGAYEARVSAFLLRYLSASGASEYTGSVK